VDVLVTDHPGSGASVVTPVGQLDIDTAPRLHTTFDQLRARSITRIVVDLGELTYCDSTGLSALALARNYCTDAGGYLRLAVLNPSVLQMLTAVGIARTVPIYRSVSTACVGDLDGLIAAPRRQSPWVMPSQPRATARRSVVPSSLPPPRRTLRPLAILARNPGSPGNRRVNC
jgi:anti-sigma B factor antagonist